jgi:hypothetical protein
MMPTLGELFDLLIDERAPVAFRCHDGSARLRPAEAARMARDVRHVERSRAGVGGERPVRR